MSVFKILIRIRILNKTNSHFSLGVTELLDWRGKEIELSTVKGKFNISVPTKLTNLVRPNSHGLWRKEVVKCQKVRLSNASVKIILSARSLSIRRDEAKARGVSPNG